MLALSVDSSVFLERVKRNRPGEALRKTPRNSLLRRAYRIRCNKLKISDASPAFSESREQPLLQRNFCGRISGAGKNVHIRRFQMRRQQDREIVSSLHEMFSRQREIVQRSFLVRDKVQLLKEQIPWEDFRPLLEPVRNSSPESERPAYDELLLFKCLVLQELHELTDEELEAELCDRRSLQDFLGADAHTILPDYTTIRRFREALNREQLIKPLADLFQTHLREKGLTVDDGLIANPIFFAAPNKETKNSEK